MILTILRSNYNGGMVKKKRNVIAIDVKTTNRATTTAESIIDSSFHGNLTFLVANLVAAVAFESGFIEIRLGIEY